MTAATKDAFETMAQTGSGDAGALALGLRRGVTTVGLRALAAKTLHVAAAAPERMADIYDNAAAGWLAGPVFPPRMRTEDPLPISTGFWKAFWELVNLPADRSHEIPQLTLALAGRMDPRINQRMAAVARDLPGVTDAAAGGVPEPIEMEALAGCPPASLGFLLREELGHTGGLGEPFGPGLVALLRHMPPPLDYINVQVIQTLPLLGLVAGYSRAGLDQAGIGGFLMAQVAHHYSALATAVTLTTMAQKRPRSLELTLDSIFKGWVHGKATPPLIGAPWHELWDLRLDQVREALRVTPFASPYAAAVKRLSDESSKH